MCIRRVKFINKINNHMRIDPYMTLRTVAWSQVSKLGSKLPRHHKHYSRCQHLVRIACSNLFKYREPTSSIRRILNDRSENNKTMQNTMYVDLLPTDGPSYVIQREHSSKWRHRLVKKLCAICEIPSQPTAYYKASTNPTCVGLSFSGQAQIPFSSI